MFVVVGSSFMSEHTLGCYRTSTGRGNEALPHPHPAGRHRLRTKVTPGGTAVSHSLEENAGLRVCLAGVGDTQQPPPPTKLG